MANTFELKDFIAQSETLLDDIDELEKFDDGSPPGSDSEMQKQVRKKSLDFITSGVDLQLDGYFEIDVDGGDYTAIGSFFPPTGDREPIRVESVSEALAARQIVTGIDATAITDAVFKCNTERVPVEGVVLAQAVLPVAEQAAHQEVLQDLMAAEDHSDQDGQRDYKQTSPFILVKKGQLLARTIPAVPGVEGFTIKGLRIPFRKETTTSAKGGRNTVLNNRGLIAACDGRLTIKDRIICVSPVLDIEGNVGYRTGHLNFPGDVIVRGEVEHGFNIVAGGKVYCLRTLDVSEVKCQGDLVVRQGIIGRGTGVIQAGGSVSTRFIENCHVEAAGGVTVGTGIVNSSVNTTGNLRTGSKGIIVGGRICAQEGVVVAQVGTQSGPKTEIYCGTDFQIEQKLVLIRDRNIELAMKLPAVKQRLKAARAGSPDADELGALEAKMREAIHKLNETASQLVFQLDKSEEAQVVVAGRVFPGTYIEICHMPYVVDRTLSRVRFYLNKKEGKVTVERLTESPYRNGEDRDELRAGC